jgi:hypothetical protein
MNDGQKTVREIGLHFSTSIITPNSSRRKTKLFPHRPSRFVVRPLELTLSSFLELSWRVSGSLGFGIGTAMASSFPISPF